MLTSCENGQADHDRYKGQARVSLIPSVCSLEGGDVILVGV